MNKWLRKSLVVAFSILTFGLVTPPAALTYSDSKTDETNNVNEVSTNLSQTEGLTFENQIHDFNYKREHFINHALQQAELRSFEKFGSRIGPVIEDEFRTIIFPRIEEVITSLADHYPGEMLQQLVISEDPTGGMSEKIFHIYDEVTGQDLVRFHVRRDNPPQEGYWFNFHYHTSQDSFQTHHELGEIYWAKNTPPSWLS